MEYRKHDSFGESLVILILGVLNVLLSWFTFKYLWNNGIAVIFNTINVTMIQAGFINFFIRLVSPKIKTEESDSPIAKSIGVLIGKLFILGIGWIMIQYI